MKKITETNVNNIAASVSVVAAHWRKANDKERKEMRDALIQAFLGVGYAPHQIFPILVMIEGEDILIRYIDMIRDDLVMRRVALIAAGEVVKGS